MLLGSGIARRAPSPSSGASMGASEPYGRVLSGLLLSACDWAMFRYDAAHTGFNAAEFVISSSNVANLSRVFSASVGGGSQSSPAVAGGKVYVAGGNDTLNVFDATGATNCS